MPIICGMGRKVLRAGRTPYRGVRRTMVIGPSRAEVRAAIDALPGGAWLERSRLAVCGQCSFAADPCRLARSGRSRSACRRASMSVLGVDIGPAFLYVGSAVARGVARDAPRKRLIGRWPTCAHRSRQSVTSRWSSARSLTCPCGGTNRTAVSPRAAATGGRARARYGDEPRLLIAPMRNLLLAAPFDADRELLRLVTRRDLVRGSQRTRPAHLRSRRMAG